MSDYTSVHQSAMAGENFNQAWLDENRRTRRECVDGERGYTILQCATFPLHSFGETVTSLIFQTVAYTVVFLFVTLPGWFAGEV
ncbi:MAG: hypothetical protein GF344_15375 [Chitinivibrionales bacterium]|nr:hypothetical protein [Chitinivibrionales bacterium]MBD3358088.1 hypothetical protein [Chitinivibrionales bacterium]